MSIKIAVHGGHCCGVKTIYGFEGYPSYELPSKKATKHRDTVDLYNEKISNSFNFYHLSRPRETYLERFEAYLKFLSEYRPGGLVEIYLNDAQYRFYGWLPILEQKGFKKVCEFRNSNTSSKVHCFHLIMDGVGHNYDDDDDDEYYDEDDDYYED